MGVPSTIVWPAVADATARSHAVRSVAIVGAAQPVPSPSTVITTAGCTLVGLTDGESSVQTRTSSPAPARVVFAAGRGGMRHGLTATLGLNASGRDGTSCSICSTASADRLAALGGLVRRALAGAPDLPLDDPSGSTWTLNWVPLQTARSGRKCHRSSLFLARVRSDAETYREESLLPSTFFANRSPFGASWCAQATGSVGCTSPALSPPERLELPGRPSTTAANASPSDRRSWYRAT
jgi:hypothetical protein